ncbi:hypothetical protein [Georgenia wangjunii]|uniref:hypothetical protein n=1 Tax=Georgenia wangjunii TaxID=3117730 RepID=UPI002F26D2F0
MSNETHAPAGAPAAAAAADPHACAHCDSSVPHSHRDVREAVTTARTRARRDALVRAGVAAVLLAGALVAAGTAVGAGWALVVLAVTVAGWALSTAVGVVVAGAYRARTSDARALVIASLTAAALTPLVALAVALVGPRHLVLALVAGAGWLACTAAVEVSRARTWRTLLLEPGREGETARARAVSEEEPAGGHARWFATGVVVGAFVVALTLVPVAVVVLVPLAVVLAAVSARPPAR